MSLTITLQNAISGLATGQQALQVTSNNIANVNTEGYTRKNIETTSRVIEGVGYGVEISTISRTVDEGLLRQLRIETGTLEELNIKNATFAQLNALFGRPEDNNSITHLITELASTVDALALSPETAATQFTAVKAGISVAQELESLADEVQRLRNDANNRINIEVDTVNRALTAIVDTNTNIIEFAAAKISAADLEDQRDIALNTIAEIMDIRYFGKSDGSISLFTGGGKSLIDGTKQDLSYAKPSTMDPTLEYVPLGSSNFVGPNSSTYPAGGIPGIFVGAIEAGTDVTTQISSGRLKALIDLRDSILPSLQNQIDELSENLRDQFNAVHNQGTGYPPATILTGTRYVDELTALEDAGAKGQFRIATVDENGNVIGTDSKVFDLSVSATASTVGDLITEINAQMSNITASINSSGRLVLTAQNNYRVAINELTSDIDGAGQTDVGFSNFFGLNDFYQTTDNYSLYRSDYHTSSSSAAVTTGGTLHFSGDDGTGWQASVAYANNATLSDLVTAVNGDATLITEGVTASIVSDGSGFRLQVLDAGGHEFAIAETGGGSALDDTGLRKDSRGIARRLAVRADIQTDSFIVSRGRLQSNSFLNGAALDSSSTLLNATTPAIGSSGTLSFSYDATTAATPITVAYDITTDTLASVAAAINAEVNLIATRIKAEVIAEGNSFRLKIYQRDGDDITISDSGGLGVNTTDFQGVTIGDGSIARKMAEMFETNIVFGAAPQGGGGLPQATTTLGEYAATILSFNSALVLSNNRDLDFQQSLKDELFSKNASISSVNLDEELASMIIFEQAYIAAARMIATAQELFRVLENLV